MKVKEVDPDDGNLPGSYDKFEAEGKSKAWGWQNFGRRKFIIDPSNKVLNWGTLTVEVRIKLHDDYRCKNFVPGNCVAGNVLELLTDEETADVVFEVKEKDESSASVLVPAHKLVLKLCAKDSTLSSLCEDADKSAPVPITGVSAQVFRKVMRYLYGGSITVAEWKSSSKELIDAADMYGLKNLKIEAEAWYVQHLELTVDNVIGELDYADKKNCFLLKESATDFLLDNADEVLRSKSFDNIPESKGIMGEILSMQQ